MDKQDVYLILKRFGLKKYPSYLISPMLFIRKTKQNILLGECVLFYFVIYYKTNIHIDA
jgi:hypothetical protein